MKKIIIYISALIISGCKPELIYEIRGYTEKIIVEASIATDEYPKVYLSLNNPVWQQVDSASILKNVIRTAKVTISDGITSEILTSSWDKNHFPPYVYRGTDIRGEEGKTYTLKVEYGGYTLNSKTTIPIGTVIDKFESVPIPGNDTLRRLNMTFTINPAHQSGFRVFSKKFRNILFDETNIVFNSDLRLSGEHTYFISPEVIKMDNSNSATSNFVKGDTILIRFSAIDSTSVQFFKDLTIFSSDNGLAKGAFIGEKQSLKSNISNPGFGIWWGAAVRNYLYIIK
jgi:hypothetical protein